MEPDLPSQWAADFPALAPGYFAWHLRGPLPAPALTLGQTMLQEQASQGVNAVHDRWVDRVENTRAALANFVGVSPQQVALTQNTSTAMGLLAWGWPLGPGDEVLVGELEYPGTLLSWQAAARVRGFSVRFLRADATGLMLPGGLLAQVGPDTRLMVQSLVVFRTGQRVRIEELASELARRSPAVPLIADGVMGLGPWRLSVDDLGLAALTGDGRKWLLGADGTGFLALGKNWQERVSPTLPGPRAIQESTAYRQGDPTWLPGAQKLENGALNSLGFSLLGASLGWLQKTPWDTLRQHQLAQLALLKEGLDRLGLKTAAPLIGPDTAGLVGITHGQDPARLSNRLKAGGLTAAARGPLLMVSVYGLTRPEDIEALMAILR